MYLSVECIVQMSKQWFVTEHGTLENLYVVLGTLSNPGSYNLLNSIDARLTSGNVKRLRHTKCCVTVQRVNLFDSVVKVKSCDVYYCGGSLMVERSNNIYIYIYKVIHLQTAPY